MGYEFFAQVIGRVEKLEERELIRSLSRELEKRYRLVVELGESRVGTQTLSSYRFSHALFQQYLYSGLGAAERRLLHGEVAEVLEALFADHTDEIAIQLARHYQQAGESEKALTYLIQAGDRAFSLYAQEEAVQYYSRALELGKRGLPDIEQIKHLYTRRGRALELGNQHALALENYDEMCRVARERRDIHLELAAIVAASTVYSTINASMNTDKGQALSEEALELSRKLGDRAAEAKILWNLTLVNLMKENIPDAIASGEQSLKIARELTLREQLAYTLGDIGWAYNMIGEFHEAELRLEEAGRLWREFDNLPMLANNLNLLLFGLCWAGKMEQALRAAEESYQISLSIKNHGTEAWSRHWQGVIWLDLGEVDKAFTALQESLDLAQEYDNGLYVIWFSSTLRLAYATLGAGQIASDRYSAYRVPNPEISTSPAKTGVVVNYALFEIATGQLDQAASTLQLCIPNGTVWDSALLYGQSKLAAAHEEFDKAIELADICLAMMHTHSIKRYYADTLLVKGKAHVRLGERDAARQALGLARSEAEASGARSILWQILALQADLEPDPLQSSALRESARQIVRHISEHMPDERLRNLFEASTDVRALMSEPK